MRKKRWGAVGLVLVLVLIGCSPRYTVTRVDTGEDVPRLRESTIEWFGDCLHQYAPQMEQGSYKLRFNVKSTAEGAVLDIESDSGDYPHWDLIACMKQALRAMPIPSDALRSTAAMNPESRKYN